MIFQIYLVRREERPRFTSNSVDVVRKFRLKANRPSDICSQFSASDISSLHSSHRAQPPFFREINLQQSLTKPKGSLQNLLQVFPEKMKNVSAHLDEQKKVTLYGRGLQFLHPFLGNFLKSLCNLVPIAGKHMF